MAETKFENYYFENECFRMQTNCDIALDNLKTFKARIEVWKIKHVKVHVSKAEALYGVDLKGRPILSLKLDDPLPGPEYIRCDRGHCPLLRRLSIEKIQRIGTKGTKKYTYLFYYDEGGSTWRAADMDYIWLR